MKCEKQTFFEEILDSGGFLLPSHRSILLPHQDEPVEVDDRSEEVFPVEEKRNSKESLKKGDEKSKRSYLEMRVRKEMIRRGGIVYE